MLFMSETQHQNSKDIDNIENNTPTQIEPREKFHLNQDSKQMIKSTLGLCIEFYRVLMGTFLVLFVPQKCGESICSFSENLYSEERSKYISLYTNLGCFVICILVLNRILSRVFTYPSLEVNRFNQMIKSVEQALRN